MKFYKITLTVQDLIDKIATFDENRIKNDLQKFMALHDRNLVTHLKELALKQILSRQEFTIASTDNLDYTKIPGGSFSGKDKLIYNLKKTRIMSIKRQSENRLTVKIVNEDGDERTGYIRARNRNGIRELNIIERNLRSLKSQSYDELINYKFYYAANAKI